MLKDKSFLQICVATLIIIFALFQSATALETKTDIKEKWGVEIERVRLTAGGYMLDFRYRVLDPEKAMPLFDRNFKPYLVDEATGAMFVVPESPKVGAMRTTRKPKPDRNYFIIFANPGKFIKPGNKVTVVIGDFRAENLIVQ
jgi:hypothetical protein